MDLAAHLGFPDLNGGFFGEEVFLDLDGWSAEFYRISLEVSWLATGIKKQQGSC